MRSCDDHEDAALAAQAGALRPGADLALVWAYANALARRAAARAQPPDEPAVPPGAPSGERPR